MNQMESVHLVWSWFEQIDHQTKLWNIPGDLNIDRTFNDNSELSLIFRYVNAIVIFWVYLLEIFANLRGVL